MLLIQTAFAPETSAIQRAGESLGQLHGLPGIRIADKSCAILQTGMGPSAARHSLHALLERIEPPELVLSIGLAGSLVPEFQIGDFALIERVCLTDEPTGIGGQWSEVIGDAARRNTTNDAARRATFIDAARRATLVTIPRIAFTPEDKRRILSCVEAQLCDMETYSVAHECQQRQILWVGARVVSDTASETIKVWTTRLPELLDKKRYLRFLWLLATHPQDLPTLVRLGFRMQFLQRQLTQLTRDLVTHVPAA